MEEIEPEPGASRSFPSPLLSGHHHPIRDGVGSQGAGAEALRVGSKLVLFPLSVCPPSSWQQHLQPKRSDAEARGVRAGARCGLECAGTFLACQSEFQTAPDPALP